MKKKEQQMLQINTSQIEGMGGVISTGYVSSGMGVGALGLSQIQQSAGLIIKQSSMAPKKVSNNFPRPGISLTQNSSKLGGSIIS